MYERQPTWIPPGPAHFGRPGSGWGLGTVITLPALSNSANNPSWQGPASPDSLSQTSVNLDAFGYQSDPSASVCTPGADPSNPNCLSAAGQAIQSPSSSTPAGTPSNSQALIWLAAVTVGLLIFVKVAK